MKQNFIHSRKFRHGSVSVALTVLIIAAVVILNVIASALAARYSWMYIDMTAEGLYTLSDDAVELLEKSLIEIVNERKELNTDLPKANLEIAKDNIDVAEQNVKLAESALATALANLDVAKVNKLAFEQSEIHAKRNVNIAENNIDIANMLLEFIKENASEITAEEKATIEKNAQIAKENLATAKANLVKAASNKAKKATNDENDKYNKQNELKEGDEGYRPLLPYESLDGYKSYDSIKGFGYDTDFDNHIVYENMTTAETNVENAQKNIEATKANLEIAKANLKIAEANAQKDVIKGENGYEALTEFTKLLEFKAYGTIVGFTEPEKFATAVKFGPAEAERELYNEDVKVSIIFCDLEDNLRSNETQNMVLKSARDLAEKFPDFIEVKHIDIWNDFTAVQKYKSTSYSTINSTNVIIESGTEYRICTLRSFFAFNEASDTTPWGYKGEKVLISAILAVSQAESPIACVTTNHTESFSDYELFYTLESAGYKVQTIDLAYQEIPEDCRLVVVYNPKEDFMQADGVSEISEIEKLDRYLNGMSCSMMVFVDAQTPKLPNLEEYLEEWGVVINRTTDTLGGTYNYTIKEDPSVSLSTDGFTFAGTYVEKGMGADIYKTLTENNYPPKVVFKNATSLSYSSMYEETFFVNDEDPEDTTDEYWYGHYYGSGVSRSIYDVFTTSNQALAMANGSVVKNNDSLQPYHRLMTMTRESRNIDGQNYDYAYVMVCASTEFATEKLLGSAVYGNDDVILAAARGMGKEVVPVDLKIKPFASTEISDITTETKNTYTAVLAIVPAVIIIGVGVFVLVRRKYS